MLAGIGRLDAVILPKAERPEDVLAVAQSLTEASRNRAKPVEIELLIETALGVVNVAALANASPAVTALHFGVGDFAASIGARTPDIGISPPLYKHLGVTPNGKTETPLDLFVYPMMALLTAARAFGLRAIDGPCGAFHDADIFSASAMKAAAMGFDGKQVIHPKQIESTRDAFKPSAEEVAHARRVIAAMEAAARDGKGAATVDGRMVDFVNIRMAERMLLHMA